ncbi:inorganic pyrophosphatase 2-like [Silene latifolia]|uniref:inorganic pyrophosphatase 2-like n=1 Tax=Silene latifolia TaxID=37657 RepID=UPI003D778CA5
MHQIKLLINRIIMGEVVVMFDFDKTIIDVDSDDWVIHSFGITQLFTTLLPNMPYNFLMDKMMEELHLRGITIQEIVDCLKKVPLSPYIISSIKLAYTSGCDLRILSDANTFFIETILENHGVLHCFSEINTNPAVVTEHGRLKIMPYHDFNASSHGCNLCPPNLCKGLVAKRIQAPLSTKQIIYIGDGNNDFCPAIKLRARDYVMPRKNFQLWDAICRNRDLVNAAVHEWDDDQVLERNLMSLITSLITKDNHISVAGELMLTDCKPQTSQSSVPEAFQKAVQVRH